jgi:hypothetical protein
MALDPLRSVKHIWQKMVLGVLTMAKKETIIRPAKTKRDGASLVLQGSVFVPKPTHCGTWRTVSDNATMQQGSKSAYILSM